MGRDERFERINFRVTGELAAWMRKMKRRGYFATNPEIVRFALMIVSNYPVSEIAQRFSKEGSSVD